MAPSVGAPEPGTRAERKEVGVVPVVAEHVRGHRDHYAVIVRERTAGPPRVREAIRHEIELITGELATDIARTGGAQDYSSTDIGA